MIMLKHYPGLTRQAIDGNEKNIDTKCLQSSNKKVGAKKLEQIMIELWP